MRLLYFSTIHPLMPALPCCACVFPVPVSSLQVARTGRVALRRDSGVSSLFLEQAE